MRDLSATELEAAQKAADLDPVIKVTLTHNATEYVLEEDRLLKLNHIEEPDHINAKGTLFDNADGYFTAKDLKGYQAVVSYGLITKTGKEYSATSPMKVTWQQLGSSPGKLTCELTILGIPDLMDQDEASALYKPAEADTKTVKTLLREIAGDSGVTHLACFNHCQKYDMVFDSEDELIVAYMPKDSFRIYVGGSRWAAFKRLLSYTGCVQRIGSDGKIHILVPTTTGESYDYQYSLESGHTFFSKAYRKALVIPNRIVVQSQPDDDPPFSGEATDPVSYALLPKTKYYQVRLQDDDEAEDIAEAIIGRYQLDAEMGAADVPMNVGAELYDYVKVTDEREDDHRIGNLGSIARTYKPGQYSMRFTFGDPPVIQHIRELYQSIRQQASAEYGWDFARLVVGDLYAEHIQAENIDLIWLDPEGNVDLSQIGDTLDSLADGELYARVKSLHLDAGQVKLDEYVYYAAGYDPAEKRRTFTAEPTTPYDLGDLWFDGAVVKRCTTARASGDYVANDWTAVGLDEIGDGVEYKRLLSNQITAGQILLSDLCEFSTGYNPAEKRRTFTAQPTTPYDVGDLWLDDDVIKRCTTARAEGAYVANDWTATTLDAIAEGSTYKRVSTNAVTAQGMVLLDEVITGDYGIVLSADITAGHIKMSSVEDYGGYGKILLTDLSDGHLNLTADFKIGGQSQATVGVYIDAVDGIRIVGGKLKLLSSDTEEEAVIYLEHPEVGASILHLDAAGWVKTQSLAPDINYAYPATGRYLGFTNLIWYAGYIRKVYTNELEAMIGNIRAHDTMEPFTTEVGALGTALKVWLGAFSKHYSIYSGGVQKGNIGVLGGTLLVGALDNLQLGLAAPIGQKIVMTADALDMSNLDYMDLPTRATQPTGAEGRVFRNTTFNWIETYINGGWERYP